jgi:hypothetical protein
MRYSFEGLNGQFYIQYVEQEFFFALEKNRIFGLRPSSSVL